MEKKFKTQVLTVSKRFLFGHPRAGQETMFANKIRNGVGITCKECREVERFDGDCCGFIPKQSGDKIHTIRDNRPYWRSVFERNMLLSVRQWSGKPYQTPQETFLDIEPGKWGVQEITMIKGENGLEAYVNEQSIDIDTLAANDGLSRADFEAWFDPHFKRKNVFYGMIIHFTDFRY
ncbi:hypothetical protein LJC39_04075 [Parabacteroides sp. OttesenSCG-928-B22]|nr:hypothetical protein [Parabacteroides sp. OttesenSCG-928-B22]